MSVVRYDNAWSLTVYLTQQSPGSLLFNLSKFEEGIGVNARPILGCQSSFIKEICFIQSEISKHSMRDDDASLVLESVLKKIVNSFFRFIIQMRCCLVKYYNIRVP